MGAGDCCGGIIMNTTYGLDAIPPPVKTGGLLAVFFELYRTSIRIVETIIFSTTSNQLSVNYHRLKPVACERLSETKQLD